MNFGTFDESFYAQLIELQVRASGVPESDIVEVATLYATVMLFTKFKAVVDDVLARRFTSEEIAEMERRQGDALAVKWKAVFPEVVKDVAAIVDVAVNDFNAKAAMGASRGGRA